VSLRGLATLCGGGALSPSDRSCLRAAAFQPDGRSKARSACRPVLAGDSACNPQPEQARRFDRESASDSLYNFRYWAPKNPSAVFRFLLRPRSVHLTVIF